MANPLDSFSPPVREWFRQTFGRPTPPQEQGWPPIQRGDHTLILAPTGSGKTLTAFLWGIDELYRFKLEQEQVDARETGSDKRASGRRTQSGRKHAGGVRVLYVSPLKALNNDIERNLRAPLEGIREAARRLGSPLPALRVMVRTGDTPSSVRAQMVKQPPDILITTPESLYLMLTSPRAREMFRTVRSVIVDEIHTLVGTKRGTHLSLSLERLAHLAAAPVQRIGLSATIRPLDEAARFLGGQEEAEGQPGEFVPRPVTIVDAHYNKALDLKVITVVDDFKDAPGASIWPSIIPQVLDDVRRHHTTLIFSNNRRLAERTADRLNTQLAAEQSEEIPPGGLALAPDGVMHDRGIFGIGTAGPFRAHHGSMSKESRHQMEEDLKSGKLPALVGTSSLELGIDIGSVDLVVQLQSPKSVAQGLQRVGRSGHLVGQTSRGRIYPTFREDLAEAAAIARGMMEGDVELTFAPESPLDVLAQQIVAMVAVEPWSVPTLLSLVRRAYPYRNLSEQSFRSVLDMLSGRYYAEPLSQHLRPASALRAKIAWDRVHDRLAALPGSRLIAMSNAGTIPNTGAYPVYLQDGKTKIGELDEEFIFETRPGDAFILGSSVWRVHEMTDDRIVVADAAGATPRMPFWNGDYPYRPYELGARIGRFRHEISDRIRQEPENLPAVESWLMQDHLLDERSARNLAAHVKHQLDAVGVMSSDRTIVIESFQNAVGDPYMVIHSPFGGRVNGAWALALASALREKTNVVPEVQTNDDGIIFRFPQSDLEPPVDIVRNMTAEEARERILRELPDSAVFGAQFRKNAARALLLTKSPKQMRTPFWLQRLKAKDLLALVKKFDDFPIVAETYRDCLRDVFDLPHLEEILNRINAGEIRVMPIETAIPSPVASGLLFQFISIYMYEWDAPKAERQIQALSFKREALQDALQGVTLSDLLKPEAIAEVTARLQHTGPGSRARTAEELAVFMAELGDLTEQEIMARCTAEGGVWLEQLVSQGRLVSLNVPANGIAQERYVPVELEGEYDKFLSAGLEGPAAAPILHRFMRNNGPVTRSGILARYAFPEPWLDATLGEMVTRRELIAGSFTAHDRQEFCDPHVLEQIHRRTLNLLREEIKPVSLSAYSAFLAVWQKLPGAEPGGVDGLRRVLAQLRGIGLPGSTWESDILPARVSGYDFSALQALCETGEVSWVGSGSEARRMRVRFLFRGDGSLFLPPPNIADLSPEASAVYEHLKQEGASFAADIASALGLKEAATQSLLAQLAAAGLVTNDSVQTLRELIAGENAGARPVDGRTKPTAAASALESDLEQRLGPRPLSGTRYRDVKRRVALRLRNEMRPLSDRRPPPARSRWALVHRQALLGRPLSEEERAEKTSRVLLARYGVLTRESVEREEGVDWGLVYPALQRMELRGEVRRGYFVAGLASPQFALPDAVEKLRAAVNVGDSLVVVSATDPANIFGGELEKAPLTSSGEPLRFARVASTHLVLWRGAPVLLAEDNGERLTTMEDVPEGIVSRALELYFSRTGAPRRVTVSQWNGKRLRGGAGEVQLRALGFYSGPSGMERWADR